MHQCYIKLLQEHVPVTAYRNGLFYIILPPVGLTSRTSIPAIVMQGGTFGPMQCSNSIDDIGKKCISRQEHLYAYKKQVKITPLAMVDDLLAVAPCGIESVAVNVFINLQIEMKKLEFHTPDVNGKRMQILFVFWLDVINI